MIPSNSTSQHLIYLKNTRVLRRSTNLRLPICVNWRETRYCKVDGRCRSRNIGWVIVGIYLVRRVMISTRPTCPPSGSLIDTPPSLRNCKSWYPRIYRRTDTQLAHSTWYQACILYSPSDTYEDSYPWSFSFTLGPSQTTRSSRTTTRNANPFLGCGCSSYGYG
jgi:hypothetical protein